MRSSGSVSNQMPTAGPEQRQRRDFYSTPRREVPDSQKAGPAQINRNVCPTSRAGTVRDAARQVAGALPSKRARSSVRRARRRARMSAWSHNELRSGDATELQLASRTDGAVVGSGVRERLAPSRGLSFGRPEHGVQSGDCFAARSRAELHVDRLQMTLDRIGGYVEPTGHLFRAQLSRHQCHDA